MKKLISVVIPAYNEAENLIVIIDRLESVFIKTGYDAEFIFIEFTINRTGSFAEDTSSF